MCMCTIADWYWLHRSVPKHRYNVLPAADEDRTYDDCKAKPGGNSVVSHHSGGPIWSAYCWNNDVDNNRCYIAYPAVSINNTPAHTNWCRWTSRFHAAWPQPRPEATSTDRRKATEGPIVSCHGDTVAANSHSTLPSGIDHKATGVRTTTALIIFCSGYC